jgi:hypothetical protein
MLDYTRVLPRRQRLCVFQRHFTLADRRYRLHLAIGGVEPNPILVTPERVTTLQYGTVAVGEAVKVRRTVAKD